MPKMSQHIQHHHPQQPQYVHYTGPPGAQLTVAPQDTTRQPTSQFQQPLQFEQHQVHQASGNTSVTSVSSATAQNNAIVATGDWTKDLIHLAKTAELKYVSASLYFTTCLPCSCSYRSMSCFFLIIQGFEQDHHRSCFLYKQTFCFIGSEN